MSPVYAFLYLLLFSALFFLFIYLAVDGFRNGYRPACLGFGVMALLIVVLIAKLITASTSVNASATKPAITVTANAVNMNIVWKDKEVDCATREAVETPPWNHEFWFQITLDGPQAVIAQTVLVPGEPQLAYKASRTFLANIRYRDLPAFSNWIRARAQRKAHYADWFSRREFKTLCFADGTQAVEIMF